ncbi:MAG: Mur ligase family protein, partial [Mucinivorans sp.]
SAYKEGLQTSLCLDDHLGHAHRSFKTIHVAGTNGKGSSSQMIYEVLREAGHHVGLYTSPHLRDFRERIVVDGEMIAEQAVVEFVRNNRAIIESLHPSFFEMTVAMAFDYFRAKKVDIAVVEVGLGGRLDATNIITPEVSLITNIDFDHQQFLGHTLPLIAAEKAGIIKDGVPVVVGESSPMTAPVFIDKARSCSAPLIFADQRYICTAQQGFHFTVYSKVEEFSFEVELGMQGHYQARNLCSVLACLDVLSKSVPLSREEILGGLARAKVAGRWQTKGQQPLTICDTGHNRAGIGYVVEQLAGQHYEKLYFVIGMVSDKDTKEIMGMLPKEAYYIFTQASTHR